MVLVAQGIYEFGYTTRTVRTTSEIFNLYDLIPLDVMPHSAPAHCIQLAFSSVHTCTYSDTSPSFLLPPAPSHNPPLNHEPLLLLAPPRSGRRRPQLDRAIPIIRSILFFITSTPISASTPEELSGLKGLTVVHGVFVDVRSAMYNSPVLSKDQIGMGMQGNL